MAQAPSIPQPRKAGESPLAATLLASVLLNQGAQHEDKDQIAQGRKLLKLAEAAKGKLPKLPHSSKMAKAIKAQAKTGVVK